MTDKVLDKIICQRIIDLCNNSGLTKEQLALQSGISKGGLSEICRYMKEPKIRTVAKICAGLGIRVTDFFDFTEIDNYVDTL